MVNKKYNNRTGRRGEELACKFLTGKGHRIIARNWRSGHLEIDIVSADVNGIHFVEVKSRTVPFQAEPQECVTAGKRRNITKAAARFLGTGGKCSGECAEYHFDIVSVVFENGESKLDFFPDAWIPVFY